MNIAISDQQQLVTIDPQNALTLFSAPGAFDPILSAVREKIDAFVCPSMDTKRGRDELRRFANDIAKTKVYLDDAGKILVRDLKEIPGKVDATRRRMRDTLDQWKEETRAPLTAWEEAEDARIKRHREAIDGLNAGFMPGSSIDGMRSYIARIEAIEISPAVCDEFEAEYARAKDATLRACRAALADRERYEAEQAELARLRAAEAEREAARKKEAEAAAKAERERLAREREERRAAEAVEAERKRAEQAARREREEAERHAQAERDAADRRERDLKEQAAAAERRAAEAEAKAKRDAAQAIADARRREEEQRASERAEAERRENNKRIAATAQRKAREAFVAGGLTEEAAALAVTLIASRKVPAVAISY